MKPKRIQRKRTRGWKMPRNTLYVGRPTDYGNPFRPKSKYRNLAVWVAIYGLMTQDQIHAWYENGGACVQDAAHAVALFRDYANWRINIAVGGKAWIEKLRGKNLACWCSLDQPCHADVLLEIANP